MAVLFVIVLCAAAGSGLALHVTDEEYTQFPKLYHLDDYSSCLAKPDGVYCVGTFHILPPRQPDHTYHLLKEYSEDPYHFNRTLLHRGYCVSERCPSTTERNTTLRFERCGAQWGRRRRMRLALQRLRYCKTHAQEYARKQNPEPLDLPQRALLAVVTVLVVTNVVGTCYDLLLGDNDKKNNLLALWSIRGNWNRLTASYEDGDPRIKALSPVQGVRVLLMLLIIGTHTGCIHDMLFLQNPRFVEEVARHPVFMIFMNGTSVVMFFILISNFLLAYNLLLLSKKLRLSVNMLPYCIIKRVSRISPLSIIVVGYAATFWAQTADGPMWPTLVVPEAEICRQKFWAHVLYLNNLYQAEDHCLVQTWFLATDMQLYIVASLLTLWLANRRRLALPLLALLTVASCLLNGALAYYFDWQSIMYHVYPSTMHTMYKEVPSFYRLYTAPWGSLPACLVGLLTAHLHFELQEKGINPVDYRVFRWLYTIAIPLIVSWILGGNLVREWTDPEFTATYVALERPVISMLGALVLIGISNNITGFVSGYFSWRGWQAMGRLSLAVLMVHWCLNAFVAASRPSPISTSLLEVTVEAVGVAALSYIIAIPLTLMIEMPISRLINELIFKRKQKLA